MLKSTISLALAALLIYAALTSGIVVLDRVSTTRVRAEIFGSAAVLDLDRIGKFVEYFTDTAEIWLDALPVSMAESIKNIGESALIFVESVIPDTYRPSCSLC